VTALRPARSLLALGILATGLLGGAAPVQAQPYAVYTEHRAVVVRSLPPGQRYEVVRGTRYVVDRHGRWHRVAGPQWMLVARPLAAPEPSSAPRAVPLVPVPAPRMRIVPGQQAPAVPSRPAPGRGVTLSPRAPIISA
jgi:hypothetical protein